MNNKREKRIQRKESEQRSFASSAKENLSKVLGSITLSELSARLDLSEKPGDEPAENVAAKLSFKATVDRGFVRLAREELEQGNSALGHLLWLLTTRNAEFDLALEDWSTLQKIKNQLVPDSKKVDQHIGFDSLKKAYLPKLAPLLKDEDAGRFLLPLYTSVIELLSELHSVQLVASNHVLTVSCTGFSLFDGYLPHPSELDQYVASKSESVDEDPEETPVVACFSGPREMKIVVLGAPGVGKSGSVVQFIMNVFVEDYDPTIEDSYRKQFSFDDQTAMLEILDTAGTDQYAAMSELYMKNGEGFYLVYSLSDSSSFDKLRELRNKIVDVKCDNNVPMVVVANKADLEEKDIVVPASKGEALAEEWNVPFFVTSAKTRQNIEEAFRALVRKIHEKQ